MSAPRVAPATDLAWMELQVRTLFRHDDDGRLVAWNQPEDPALPVPRFFLGRTPHGSLWRFAAGLPDELVRTLARLASAERSPAQFDSDPVRLAVLRERLETAAPIERDWSGPAFRFPEDLPEPGDVAVLGEPDRAQLAESFPEIEASFADHGPIVAVREGGRVVSVCYDAVHTESAAEAGVQTLPEARGRGLAGRVTAAWARAQRERGRIPLYSTSWQNRASRAVARKLGLILYGSDLHMR